MFSKDLEDLALRVSQEFKWPHEGTLILAVSGGPDSTLMTMVMKKISIEACFNLHIVHIDHCLRGKDSLRDSQFVHKLAQKYDINCTIKRIDIPHIMGEDKGSTQEVCRIHRIEFLEAMAERYSAFGIAYGHNENDQAETFLMNLIRGAGTTGLAGMNEYSYQDGLLIARPLLKVAREKIVELLEQNEQSYMLDLSNLLDDYTRNHVRLNLIPFLEENYNPKIITSLIRANQIISNDNNYLEQVVEKYFEKHFVIDNGVIYVIINDISNLHEAIQMRLLRYAYNILIGNLDELSYFHSKEMLKVIEKDHGFTLDLPSEVTCKRIYDRMYLYKKNHFEVSSLNKQEIVLDEIIDTGCTKLKFSLVDKVEETNFFIDKTDLAYDYDEIEFPIFIRSRKPGDRISPFGMKGSKKVKDLMIDQKIVPHLRKAVPILVDKNDNVLAVIGIRRSKHAPLKQNTKRILLCKILEVSQWTEI